HWWYSDFLPRWLQLSAPIHGLILDLHPTPGIVVDSPQVGHFPARTPGYALLAITFESGHLRIYGFHFDPLKRMPALQTGQSCFAATADRAVNRNAAIPSRHKPHSYQCPLVSIKRLRLFLLQIQWLSVMRFLQASDPPELQPGSRARKTAAAPA